MKIIAVKVFQLKQLKRNNLKEFRVLLKQARGLAAHGPRPGGPSHGPRPTSRPAARGPQIFGQWYIKAHVHLGISGAWSTVDLQKQLSTKHTREFIT